MHEVITISVGQRANHTATQFFNCQQELLWGDAQSLSDPSIFLHPTVDRASKTVSYTPRLLLWDAKNGSGALGKYQYSQGEDYFFDENNDEDNNDGHRVIITHPVIRKSDYQNALDSGSSDLPKLTKETTKYWSDYSKLIYSPTSFNALSNWYHDVSKPNLPDFENLGLKQFDDYEAGFQEFNENYLIDFFDGNLHAQLEQCDTLQGFNLITDMDSGWGGFATAILQELRNELPKKCIFNWGYNQDDPLTTSVSKHREPRFSRSTLPLVENKIKATAYMSEDSDIMIPLYANPELSNWEQGGFTCKFMDTILSVLSQSNLEERKSMDFIKNCFTLGDTSRSFISSIMDGTSVNHSYYAKVMLYKNHRIQEHIFSECSITRENTSMGNQASLNKKELKTHAYYPSDTIPENFADEKEFTVSFSTTEACRNVFMHYQSIVSKYMKMASDSEELADRLASMASKYEYGWYDDEESDDNM